MISNLRFNSLLAVLTLVPAVVNWIALWILNDCWIAIVISTIVFYGGAYWALQAFGLQGRIGPGQGGGRGSLLWGAAAAAVVAALIAVAGSIYFQRAIPGNMLAVCSARLSMGHALRYSPWHFFLFVGIVLPLGEEMYWRGGLQGLLEQRYGAGRAIGLSAVLFTVYHCMTVSYLMPSVAGVPLVISVFIGGLLFAWLTARTRSIWAAAICHGPGAWGATAWLVWKFLR